MSAEKPITKEALDYLLNTLSPVAREAVVGKLTSRVGLYRWLNQGGAELGQPFPLCDYHALTRRDVPELIMRKVLDVTGQRCNRCTSRRPG